MQPVKRETRQSSRQPLAAAVKPKPTPNNNNVRVDSDSEGEEPSHQTQQTQKTAGKRGRKLTDEKTYKDESLKKIKELQTALKKKGLSVEERQKIRNKISAQQSRLKKKEEFSTLYVQHQHFLGRLKALQGILNEELQGDVRYRVA